MFGLLLQLAVYVSSQVPEVVVGDPSRFRQIITNLVGNSIKVIQFPTSLQKKKVFLHYK